MGFFSWNCKCCGHSIRSTYSTNKTSAWMKSAVAFTPGGKKFAGEYDGYGRLGSADFGSQMDEPCMYHKACWELAGKPGFNGSSDSAGDQGFFMDGDPAKPTSLQDIEGLKALMAAQQAKERAEAKAYYTRRVAELEAEGKEVPDYMRRAVTRASEEG